MPTTDDLLRKLIDRSDVLSLAALARSMIFTNGVFDILHRRHVSYLAATSALGASLVVAVNSDASARELGKGTGRLLNTKWRGDYDIEALAETALVRSWGGRALALPFVEGYSTTSGIRSILGRDTIR